MRRRTCSTTTWRRCRGFTGRCGRKRITAGRCAKKGAELGAGAADGRPVEPHISPIQYCVAGSGGAGSAVGGGSAGGSTAAAVPARMERRRGVLVWRLLLDPVCAGGAWRNGRGHRVGGIPAVLRGQGAALGGVRAAGGNPDAAMVGHSGSGGA